MSFNITRRAFSRQIAAATALLAFPALPRGLYDDEILHTEFLSDEPDVHSFVIGDYKCTCFNDSMVDYPLENFFKNVQAETVREVLKSNGLPSERVFTPLTHLVVETGKNKILVDTGLGRNLVPLMKKSGIDPGIIDTVLLTHAHPDHIGGVLNAEGTLNFPNARFFISKTESEFWFSENASKMTFERHIAPARKALTAIEDRITLVDGPTKIFKGVSSLPAPGHTPGHTVYSFHDKLFYTGDTVLYQLHLQHPDWLPIYDILPDKAATTKKDLFDLIAKKKAIAVAQQFNPFPSLGRIKKYETGWNWIKGIDI